MLSTTSAAGRSRTTASSIASSLVAEYTTRPSGWTPSRSARPASCSTDSSPETYITLGGGGEAEAMTRALAEEPRDLQNERRLPDARVAAHEHQRARDDPAAEDALHLRAQLRGDAQTRASDVFPGRVRGEDRGEATRRRGRFDPPASRRRRGECVVGGGGVPSSRRRRKHVRCRHRTARGLRRGRERSRARAASRGFPAAARRRDRERLERLPRLAVRAPPVKLVVILAAVLAEVALLRRLGRLPAGRGRAPAERAARRDDRRAAAAVVLARWGREERDAVDATMMKKMMRRSRGGRRFRAGKRRRRRRRVAGAGAGVDRRDRRARARDASSEEAARAAAEGGADRHRVRRRASDRGDAAHGKSGDLATNAVVAVVI
eukprot:31371-Pelagococcus_subviridis.AAC.3